MTMVERVARALCAMNGGNPDNIEGMPGAEYPQWQIYIPDARAAIEAMREPTPAMTRARASMEPLTPIWQAMITAALEGEG